MAQTTSVAMHGRLTDWISVGVLAASVGRDVVDEAVAACGKQAQRCDGKLPPHVMVYFVMAMALFADDDYEEVLARLTESVSQWDCWDKEWEMPGSPGITQARQRLGPEPVKEVFERVCAPVAEESTRGAWLAGWRVVSVDGFEWDAPDTPANVAAFGYGGGKGHPSAFPKVRVLTLVESASHAVFGAAVGASGGKGTGERSLARQLLPLLDETMLLLADRGFYSFDGWCQAADTGAALLWRVAESLQLPLVAEGGDGSYTSVVFASRVRAGERERILADARAGREVDPQRARIVRVVAYEVTNRAGNGRGETIRLVTTILDPVEVPAGLLAQTYHARWEHETSNDQLKTHLRGPARILRSQSPDMVRQEIYGYLLTHHAISALVCQAATAADIDPDRVKFLRTVRLVRRRIADPAAFSP
jgi:Insertion element 4 transposase N-terminal/Transposase DDE domain